MTLYTYNIEYTDCFFNRYKHLNPDKCGQRTIRDAKKNWCCTVKIDMSTRFQLIEILEGKKWGICRLSAAGGVLSLENNYYIMII